MIDIQNVIETVTPPLSPILQPIEPYEPSISDPAFQLPILSDPVSLTQFELSTIEAKVAEQDGPTPLRNDLNDYYATSCKLNKEDGSISMADPDCPLESVIPDSSPSIIENQPIKRDIFKIEGPLTPPMPLPVPKSVHFSDFVEEMLLDTSSLSPLDPLCNNTHFEKMFGSAAKATTEHIEQETLLAADAMGRVEVPVMDFAVSDPPWKTSPNAEIPMSSFSIQTEIIKDAIGKGLPTWPGQKNGQARLKWNPFPHDLAENSLKKDYSHDDSRWQILSKGPEDDQIIDTSTLTWKPPGLKILKEYDDDEIEHGNFQEKPPQDIVLLAKKRRMVFEVGGTDLLGKDSTRSEERALNISSNQLATPLEKRNTPKSNAQSAANAQGERVDLEEFGLLMGDAFSAGSALDSFLELRGIKKQKLTRGPHFTKGSKQHQAQIETTRPEVLDQTTTQLSQLGSAADKTAPFSVPGLCVPTAPISLILSSTVLKNRALVKFLEAQLPGLKLIERDFTAHNTIAWLPNSVTRSPISSPLDSEADLIVSPSTGIVLTTLQKIKQKPLPGQKTKVPIRERLEKISVRYEKLIVLVNKGGVGESYSGLDENDCLAFSEFVGFTSGLAATVLVQFVGGGEPTLFKWLLNSIVQHAITESSLIEEETHWELFLRRAGMNTFAAQSISAAMKGSEELCLSGSNKPGEYDLAAFVQMERQKRIDSFGEMCGKKLLERVSDCLDARWQ